MRIKFLLLILLIPLLSFTQSPETNLTVDTWSEGILDSNNNVVKRENVRGGISRIKFNDDKTMRYSSGISCGFGVMKFGTWNYDNLNNKITVHYFKQKTYNGSRNEKIDTQFIFDVARLNKHELILLDTKKPQNKLYFYK